MGLSSRSAFFNVQKVFLLVRSVSQTGLLFSQTSFCLHKNNLSDIANYAYYSHKKVFATLNASYENSQCVTSKSKRNSKNRAGVILKSSGLNVLRSFPRFFRVVI